jgi:hypothetical protein
MKINLEQLKNEVFETENQLQCKTVLMISQEFPKLRGKFFHVQNENWIRRISIETSKGNWRVETNSEYEKRKLIEGSQAKAKGMLAGVMDLILPHNGIMYKLELKLHEGILSDKQKELIILYDKDCPQLPVCVSRNLYTSYMYCRWICDNDLKINFPNNFKPFSL